MKKVWLILRLVLRYFCILFLVKSISLHISYLPDWKAIIGIVLNMVLFLMLINNKIKVEGENNDKGK